MATCITRVCGTLAVILVLLAGCAIGSRGPTRPVYPVHGLPEYRVHGRIVDAETGETISLERLTVRFYMDGLPLVRADSGERFDVRLPFHEACMVVDDPRKRYFPYEESLRIPAAGLGHVVRLRPTHRVLLKGRAIDARTGGPARLGKTSVSLLGDDGAGAVYVEPDEQGRFEVYVPRGVLRFGYVNPMVLAVDPTIDLGGVEGDVVERTVLFSPAFE